MCQVVFTKLLYGLVSCSLLSIAGVQIHFQALQCAMISGDPLRGYTVESHSLFISLRHQADRQGREGKGACPWACLVGVFRKHARLCIRVEKKRLMAGIHHFMAIVKGVTFQNVSTFNSS